MRGLFNMKKFLLTLLLPLSVMANGNGPYPVTGSGGLTNGQVAGIFNEPFTVNGNVAQFTYGSTNPLYFVGMNQDPSYEGVYGYSTIYAAYTNSITTNRFFFLNQGLTMWEFSTNRFDSDGSFSTYIFLPGTFPTNALGQGWLFGPFGNFQTAFPNVINGGTLVTNSPVSRIYVQPYDITKISGYGYASLDDGGNHVADFYDTSISNGVWLGGFQDQSLNNGADHVGILTLSGTVSNSYDNCASEFILFVGSRGRIYRYKGVELNGRTGVAECKEAQLSDNSIVDYYNSDEYGHVGYGNTPHALSDGSGLHSTAWNTFWGSVSNNYIFQNILVKPSGTPGQLPNTTTNGAIDSDGSYIYLDQSGSREIALTGTNSNHNGGGLTNLNASKLTGMIPSANLVYRSGFTNIPTLTASLAVVFTTPFSPTVGTNYWVGITFDSTLGAANSTAATAKTTNGFMLTLSATIAGSQSVDYYATPYQ